MPEIEIDTSQLTFPLFTIPGTTTEFVDGSKVPTPRISLPARAGYLLHQGSAALADFEFEVKDDGTVDFDEAFDGFVTGRGEPRLTVRGLPVRLDATALDHALQPQLAGASPLPADRTHDLSLLPSPSYGFQPGPGVVADLQYGVARNGQVILDPQFSDFAQAEGNTLAIRGYPIVLDAAAADSDLVGIVQLGVRPQAPRQLIADIVPAKGYLPQTVNGVFSTAFNIERDGKVTFDPGAAGRYVVKTSSSPNPSRVGEEVTIRVYVRPVESIGNTPRGTVSLRVGADLFGSTTLDASGEATLRTALLPQGEHDISVDYTGSPSFEPSSVTVHHRVE
jgi:Bacterial Ig-like domain (group 3)